MIDDVICYACPHCLVKYRSRGGHIPQASMVMLGPSARLHICHCGITRKFYGTTLFGGVVSLE